MMLSKQDPQRADLIQGHELLQGAFFYCHMECYSLQQFLCLSLSSLFFWAHFFPIVHKNRAPAVLTSLLKNPFLKKALP